MADLPSDFTPLDPGRINAMDPIELTYWCREMCCSEADLQRVIARVGEHVAEVRAALAEPPESG
jgi:Protein of unknown function (DUF3606)